jgi:hypothetical protein
VSEEKLAEMMRDSSGEFLPPTNKDRHHIEQFLSTQCRHVTDPEDDTYNLIDLHTKKKWAMPVAMELEFYRICEIMRKKKVTFGLAMRQRGYARPFGDADILLNTSTQVSTNKDIIKGLVRESVATMLSDTVHPAGSQAITFHVLVMTRSRATLDQKSAGYKDGVHIYMDLLLPQKYRKHKTEAIAKDPKFTKEDIFYDVGKYIINTGPIMDPMAASVNPMLLGATKIGGVNYDVFCMYRVEYEYTSKKPRVVEVPAEEYASWNLVARFSPTYVDPACPPIKLDISPSLEKELEGVGQQALDNMDANEVEDISLMGVSDPQAREVISLLPLLSAARVDSYHEWMKVLMALAKYGPKYKAIARNFSLQSKTNYNAAAFEKQWEASLTKCRSLPGCNLSMLYKMAKDDDPMAYKKLTNQFLLQKFIRYIFEAISFMDAKSAHLGDFQIADILHTAFPCKYIAIPKRSASGNKLSDDSDVTYYSVVLPDSPEYRPGMAYKYAEIMNTAPVQVWLSLKMPEIMRQVNRWLIGKKNEPNQTEQEVLKASIALGVVGKAYSACQNHKTKQNIMRQFAYIAMNFSFEYDLDAHPYVMGIYDGLLEATVEPRIIQGVCDYKVSRTCFSKHMPFDPSNKFIIESTQWFIDFHPYEKFDKFLYLIMWLCQVMSSTNKDLMMLNIEGLGQNAKSTILYFIYKMLRKVGEGGYAYKLSIEYLTQTRTCSSSAQSEIMPITNARFVMMSEPKKGQRINDNKLKTLLSGEAISGRELYGREQNMEPKCLFVVGSNAPLRFDEGGERTRVYSFDWGTLRRLNIMTAECKFTSNPDANRPNQRKANPRILKEYIHDEQYQGGFLSMLSIVHALFIMMHDEQIMFVRSPNVAKETAKHINSFDTINNYVRKMFVRAKDYEMRLDGVIDMYQLWHDKEYSAVNHNRDLIREAFLSEGSSLEKYIKSRDGIYYVADCRPLAIGELPKDSDVRFTASNEFDFEDYEDYKMPPDHYLPFKGRIKRTRDAREFLEQLNNLYKSELIAYKERRAREEAQSNAEEPTA